MLKGVRLFGNVLFLVFFRQAVGFRGYAGVELEIACKYGAQNEAYKCG